MTGGPGSVILEDPVERDGPHGIRLLAGFEVNREGDMVEPTQAALRAAGAVTGIKRHLIELGSITGRETLEMDLFYGWLVAEGTAKIGVKS